MDGLFFQGLLLGMLAAVMMNVGKGVQKQHVQIFSKGRRMFRAENRRLLVGWMIGLLLTAGSTAPFSLGLKLSGSPSAIGSMTGVGLIGLTAYATLVIGERVDKADLLGIGLIVLGTSALSYLGVGDPAGRALDELRLAMGIGVLIVCAAAACVASRFWPRGHGVAFGLTAGVCIGTAIFVANAALVKAGGSLVGQLANPYPYVAVAFAIAATVVSQFGFLKGRALEVVPSVNSATILTPLLLEGMIYGHLPQPSHLVLIVVIVSGVFLLSVGAAARTAA
jgi:drug/metabolite transporter (DMT)-like permease